MATFLATRRMSPELRSRIEASVSGRRGTSGSRLAPRAVMWFRVVALATVLGCLLSLGLSKRHADVELDAERTALLVRWNREASALTARDRSVTARIEPWIRRATERYAGDAIDPEVQRVEGLDELLGRPTVYVRGSLQRLSAPKGAEETAKESVIDAFVLCLVDPPEERSEKWLVRRVRSAYSRDERMRRTTAHIARLGAVVVGLPLLGDAWQKRLREAEGSVELAALRRNFERAPLRAAKHGAKASLLLAVIDEPGDRAVPAELDGERPHDVRVVLVDLPREKPLVWLRRRVDPNWLSEGTRAEFATGVDSCALAMDVRAALSPPQSSASAGDTRPSR